jgi:hypothetical protein
MIKSVSYTRSYVIGAFLQEKIGVEIELAENQDPLEAILEAKKLTDTAHEQANPHLYNGIQPISEPTTLPTLKVEREHIEGKSVAEQIATVEELKVLEGYKLLVKNNPDWLNAYNLKLKELTE